MSGGVGHRCGLDLALLWLWHRLVATALILPLAWDPPYTTGVALKKKKRQTQEYQTNVLEKPVEKCFIKEGVVKPVKLCLKIQ